MNTHFIHKITLAIFILLLWSCKLEDDALFSNTERSIQNDGYLPLAVDNKWEYENWLAIRNRGIEQSGKKTLGRPDNSNDDVFEYSDRIGESYHPIKDVVFKTKSGSNSIDYTFSPLEGFGKTIGGFFGSFYQITKVDGKYRRKSIKKKETSEEDGGIKTDYFYELDDQVFLTDDPVPSIEPISTKTGSYGVDSKNGFYLEYEVKTYVTRILPDGLPTNLTDKVGIDDHLKIYKNVLHTTDSIKIKRLKSKSKGGVRMRVKAEIVVPPNTSRLQTRSIAETKLNGEIEVQGFVGAAIPVFLIADLTGNKSNSILISDSKLNLSMCELESKIDIDEVMEGAETTFVSNQPLYFVDSYWVKEVGNIKNITSPAKFNAEVNINNEASPISSKGFQLNPVDDKCTSKDKNTLELSFKYIGGEGIGKVQVPLTLETRSYVQNLKRVTKRSNLN